jgi:DNA mismatch endonuclease, patch repair protein
MPILANGRRIRPDIAFTRKRLAVFIDGCFWHCCPEHGRPPASNKSYWQPKLARNLERDSTDTDRLLSAGWGVLRIWEHVPLSRAIDAVEQELALPMSVFRRIS